MTARESGDTAKAKAILDDLHAQMEKQHDAELARMRTILTADQQKQFADLKLAGVVKDREFIVTGSFPANPEVKKGLSKVR